MKPSCYHPVVFAKGDDMGKNNLVFEDEVSNTESGVLAKLWRKLLIERGITPSLGLLIDRYLQDQHLNEENLAQNVKKKNRSTLISNITAKEMTIKTFLDLLRNLIKVKRLVIHIEITTAGGETSVHSLAVTGDNNIANSKLNADKKTEGDKNDTDGSSKKYT